MLLQLVLQPSIYCSHLEQKSFGDNSEMNLNVPPVFI